MFNMLNYSMIEKRFFFQFEAELRNKKIPLNDFKLKLISFLHWFDFLQSYFP